MIEYSVVPREELFEDDEAGIPTFSEDKLNAMGSGRWQLIQLTDRSAIFMREGNSGRFGRGAFG
jgi:hypothetical protein